MCVSNPCTVTQMVYTLQLGNMPLHVVCVCVCVPSVPSSVPPRSSPSVTESMSFTPLMLTLWPVQSTHSSHTWPGEDMPLICCHAPFTFSVCGSECRGAFHLLSISNSFCVCVCVRINTPRKQGGLGPLKIPLLSDLSHQIAKDYGVYLEDQGHTLRYTHTHTDV